VTSRDFGTNSSEVVLLHNTLVPDLVTVIQSAIPGIILTLPVTSNFSSVLIVFRLFFFTGIALGEVNLHCLFWQKEANGIEEETT
jgi:hypothetical protein